MQTTDGISLVEVLVGFHHVTAVILDAQPMATVMRVGDPVFTLFKETEVALAKGPLGPISMRSKIPAVVERIENGNILTQVVLNYSGYIVHALITSKSCQALDLRVGDSITALIKSTDVTLEEGQP